MDYDPADPVRQMQQGGWINVHGRTWRVPKAFVGQAVTLRPAEQAGQIDLTQPATAGPQTVTSVLEQVLPLSPV